MKNFTRTFTVKIRVGYKNDELFEDILKLIEDEGVEAVTIHARTQEQLYKGHANWDYIRRAVDLLNIPVIGNGDIWTLEDIFSMFKQTGCHSVMLGRGAMRTPWMAKWYREYGENYNEALLDRERLAYLQTYFTELEKKFRANNWSCGQIHSRFKSFSHTCFMDFLNPEEIRGKFLRSKNLEEFQQLLFQL